jgi:photosystem II stability/assembly factor-like uncharacterized protein
MKNNNYEIFNRFYQKHAKGITLSIFLCLLVTFFPLPATSLQISETESSHFQELSSLRDGWEQLESGVTQDLNSVFFICLNRGTVVGDEGIILRTGEAGGNWTPQISGVVENLYAVSYYGYSKILAIGASGTLLYTTNSGMNWTVLQTGMMGTYFSCQMINETIGVAIGVNAIFQPFFTRTNDGWNTWDSTSFYIEYGSVFYEGRLSDVYFINTSVGFATAIVDVPAGGAIVRTTDGGISWETVFFYDEALFSIDFTGGGVGYAVGEQGTVVQTLDNGESWLELESGVNTALRGIDFSSETTGIIVGDNGIILRTENAGLTWTQQTSGTTYDLRAIHCVTDMFGVVVGEQGVILRTKTGGYPEDITPPETTCTVSGTMEGDVYISDVVVTFTATDDYSGIATTMYKLDDEPWTSYDSSVPIIVGGNGHHQLLFYSIDNAGNIEEEKTCEFTIQHPPNLQITITGGFGVKIHIKNLGNTAVTNASWTLLLDGGILLIGKQKTGISTIEVGNEITLNSLVFGFGKPTITFTIASSQKIIQGSLFLFFVRL